MRELVAEDFLLLRPPLPLADAEIHLWFFPQWQTARAGTAESSELRKLLAGYLGADLTDLRIEHGEHGKPRLAGAHALEFNLSHSGGALLVGVSRSQPLGVDLEAPRRSRPVLDLARRYFDPAEATALAALPEVQRQRAFLRLWSCKEAVLKAHGRGIGYGLNRIVFELDAGGGVVRMRADAPGNSPSPWQVVRLAPSALHLGALAWNGPPCAIRAFVTAAE